MRSNKDVLIPVISLVPAGVCENCGQWQWVTRDERVADCAHECRKRGFAPAVPLPVLHARELDGGEVAAIVRAVTGRPAGLYRRVGGIDGVDAQFIGGAL